MTEKKSCLTMTFEKCVFLCGSKSVQNKDKTEITQIKVKFDIFTYKYVLSHN